MELMAVTVFEQMKQVLGFGQDDAANLRGLGRAIEPALVKVAESLRQHLEAHPATQAAVARGLAGGQELGAALLTWLRGLFAGTYDADYARGRSRVGRTHFRVGLSQHLMVAIIELVWQELSRAVRALPLRGKRAKLASLHKLLAIEIGLMAHSYQEDYTAQVRQMERETVQARLREAEQLAQVGQLAASLAHEIKNPLAGISGAIQVIRAGLKPGDPHWPVLGEVLRQINRLDRSVKDLLVYARPRPPQYQRCDLHRVIQRVLTLLRKEPEFQRVRLECNLAPDLPVIAADENQLEQLLMNLLLNAAQASWPGGLVRLSADACDARVQLIVEDHGCGMTEEVARRALEPFFTTKARGTGLGLPICQKIVEAHGGRLSIRSTPGEGTEVTVELLQYPAVCDDQQRARPAGSSARGAVDECAGVDR